MSAVRLLLVASAVVDPQRARRRKLAKRDCGCGIFSDNAWVFELAARKCVLNCAATCVQPKTHTHTHTSTQQLAVISAVNYFQLYTIQTQCNNYIVVKCVRRGAIICVICGIYSVNDNAASVGKCGVPFVGVWYLHWLLEHTHTHQGTN